MAEKIEKIEKIFRYNNKKHLIKLVKGDITEQKTDAIVNAANSNLILGAGVAGAIRKKGGPTIQKECDEIGSCKIGNAVITNGGKLRAKKVIHAVGPIFQNHTIEKANELLSHATFSSLKLLEKNYLKSITFPAISTGIYGFPEKLAAKIIIGAILKYLQTAKQTLTVQICLFSENAYKIFENELRK